MSASVVVVPFAVQAVQQIALALLNPSWMNPRKTIDTAFLAQLASSIEQLGVQVPLLVRPAETPGQYEIIAGHRRYFAAKTLNLETLPCIVRDISDDEAREIMLVENLQREDLPPLEEADAYFGLLPTLSTAAAVAARVGKPIEYVTRRLKLLTLIPFSREALSGRLITLDHALLLCKLAPAEQETALRYTLDRNNAVRQKTEDIVAEALKDAAANAKADRWRSYWEPESVPSLKSFIEREIKLELKRAPWDLGDATLLPSAGACTVCPKNTASNTALFGDLQVAAASCTDSECFNAKREAFVQLVCESVKAVGEGAVRVSWKTTSSKPRSLPGDSAGDPEAQKKYLGQVFKYGQWIDAKKGTCEFVRAGVTVDFDEQKWGDPDAKKKPGMKLTVCVEPDCTVHKKAWKQQPSSQRSGGGGYDAEAEEEKRKKRQAETDAENKIRMDLAKKAVAATTKLSFPALVEILADRDWQLKNALKRYGINWNDAAASMAGASFAKAVAAFALDLCYVEIGWHQDVKATRKEFLVMLKSLGVDGSSAFLERAEVSPTKAPAKAPQRRRPVAGDPAKAHTKKPTPSPAQKPPQRRGPVAGGPDVPKKAAKKSARKKGGK